MQNHVIFYTFPTLNRGIFYIFSVDGATELQAHSSEQIHQLQFRTDETFPVTELLLSPHPVLPRHTCPVFVFLLPQPSVTPFEVKEHHSRQGIIGRDAMNRVSTADDLHTTI